MIGASAIGSAPIGAAAGAPVIYADIAATANATDALNGALSVVLSSAMAASDTATGETLANLISRIIATDGLSVRGTFLGAASDSATFTDSVRASWNMLLASSAEVDATVTGTVYKLVAIAEAVAATDAANGRLNAFAAVAVAAVLEDFARNNWSATATAQAEITDAAMARMEAMLALADSLQATDSASGSMYLSAILADSAEVLDTPASALRALADLESSAMVYVSLRIGSTDYHGWALNTDNKAVSEHRGLSFDSLAVVQGRHFAAGPGGIFEITGKTDAGAAIAASVTPFLTDFGTQKFKRVPDLWIGASTDGALFVKVLTRDPATGVKLEDWYALVGKQGDNSQPHRAELGRGLKSTFWGLTLCNVDGADFRLRDIAMRPIVLDRRQ